MSPLGKATVVPDPTLHVTTDLASEVLKNVLAVEKHAPDLPGQTKAAIVLDTVNQVVELAPAILSLIQMFVSVFNSTGWFKKRPMK